MIQRPRGQQKRPHPHPADPPGRLGQVSHWMGQAMEDISHLSA